MDLYADNILDHYKHPRHSGQLSKKSVSHQEKNVSCGDDLTLDLLVENKIIKDLAWHGHGCAISQAAMSLLSEELIGKSVEEAERIDAAHVRALLGVPIGTRREKCAFLGLHTLKNALQAAKGERPLPWRETV